MQSRHWLTWVHEHIRDSIKEQPGSIILDKGRGTVPLERSRFHTLQCKSEKRKIVAVDGGSAFLLKGSSFSVALFNVYGAIFEGTRCVKQQNESTLAVLKMSNEKRVHVHLHTMEGAAQFDVNLLDERGGGEKPLDHAAAQVRTAMELTTARVLLEELSNGDIMLLDGSLLPHTEYDKLIYQQLQSHALKRGVVLIGISKTTELLATNGLGALTALSALAPPRSLWMYRGEGRPVVTHFVHLHARAKTPFRIDSLYEQPLLDVLAALAGCSKDPAYLGYPYPLIKAHERARILPEEVQLKKALLAETLGDLHASVSAGTTGHDFLDTL